VSALPAIRAMLAELEPPVLLELKRALELKLAPRRSKAAERVAQLGFLAELLDEHAPRRAEGAPPRVPRELYDRSRPAAAPRSERLVELYGSWLKACRAATGLLPDGRWTGPSKPWPNPTLGRRMSKDYALDEVRQAIRTCALQLGRRPTAEDYRRWRDAKLRRARRAGRADHCRLPPLSSIYLRYRAGENRWRIALDDAVIRDEDLVATQARHVSAFSESLEPPVGVAGDPPTCVTNRGRRSQTPAGSP
jgi:hypothetical protein